MLTCIDFLHKNYKSSSLLINPDRVFEKMVVLLDIESTDIQKRIEEIKNGLKPDKFTGLSSDDLKHFTLLNQLVFFISIIDRIDDYESFNDSDCNLFFFALFGLKDILDKFKFFSYLDPISNYFTGSIAELKKLSRKKNSKR